MRQTLFLSAALALIGPPKCIFLVNRPDRILLFMVDNHLVNSLVFLFMLQDEKGDLDLFKTFFWATQNVVDEKSDLDSFVTFLWVTQKNLVSLFLFESYA